MAAGDQGSGSARGGVGIVGEAVVRDAFEPPSSSNASQMSCDSSKIVEEVGTEEGAAGARLRKPRSLKKVGGARWKR